MDPDSSEHAAAVSLFEEIKARLQAGLLSPPDGATPDPLDCVGSVTHPSTGETLRFRCKPRVEVMQGATMLDPSSGHEVVVDERKIYVHTTVDLTDYVKGCAGFVDD